MSVLQNINGSLYRMDASDLVQLAAVDTEGILGGTPGATTNGQTLVDQLAADDVQAQTDIGQIKTDLSDYHVVPSRNKLKLKFSVAVANNTGVGMGTWNGYTYTINSLTVTFSVDSGGYITSINVNGTPSANTILVIHDRNTDDNLIPAGSYYGMAHCDAFPANTFVRFFTTRSGSAYVYGDVTSGSAISMTVQNGDVMGMLLNIETNGSPINLTVYPMVETAADYAVDSSFEPYYVCMRDGMFPRAEQMVLGAKNIMPFPYVTNPGTFDGASFSFNSKGQITVTATSTTGYGQYALTDYITDNRYAGMILSSGQPYSDNCYMRIREALSDGTYVREWSVDGELTIPTMESGHKYFIAVRCGVIGVAVNKVFSPMISYDGGEFAPPAMTNRELTEVKDITSSYSAKSGVTLSTYTTKVYKCGKQIQGILRFTLPSTVSSNAAIIGITSEALPAVQNIPCGIAYNVWTGIAQGMMYFDGEQIRISGASWTASQEVMLMLNYIAK